MTNITIMHRSVVHILRMLTYVVYIMTEGHTWRIDVSQLCAIKSDDSISPVRHQAFIWTLADL